MVACLRDVRVGSEVARRNVPGFDAGARHSTVRLVFFEKWSSLSCLEGRSDTTEGLINN
jgi:hypothetical protein